MENNQLISRLKDADTKLRDLKYYNTHTGAFDTLYIHTYSKEVFKDYVIQISLINGKLYSKEIHTPILSKYYGEELIKLMYTTKLLDEDWSVLEKCMMKY